ncbi:winged helix-turn-helix domain-containing protein [Fusobacterium sp. PH5-44]|uniref:winged helix-turn-helix domain-containing protein n=1 Tax=unclassified Fusobacterium TaxID=2648384 RepID=UPI003D208A17
MYNNMKYRMAIKIYKEEKVFGSGVASLLLGIKKYGSLKKTTQEMNLAYSKAWKMLKNSEKELGFSLAIREAGGEKGGGSILTNEGEKLLSDYLAFMEEANKSVNSIFKKYFEK